MKNLDLWMWLYILGSIPVLLFYSAGLSGWFFNYPIALLITIFLILGSPLVLLVLNVSSAPMWNLVALWGGALLLTTRIVWGVQAGDVPIGRQEVTMLLSFSSAAMLWAGLWTVYFLKSEKIAQIFS